MSKKTKGPSWLTGRAGWEPKANVVKTAWIGDPAVDEEASNADAYYESLDLRHLVMHQGMRPVRMFVRVPSPDEDATADSIARHRCKGDPAAYVGLLSRELFEMCVTFPDVEEAEPEYRDGMFRLPGHLMRQVSQTMPDIFMRIGGWLYQQSHLTGDEKKASSSESTPKTSETQVATTATHAGGGKKSGKAAPTSAKKRSRTKGNSRTVST